MVEKGCIFAGAAMVGPAIIGRMVGALDIPPLTTGVAVTVVPTFLTPILPIYVPIPYTLATRNTIVLITALAAVLLWVRVDAPPVEPGPVEFMQFVHCPDNHAQQEQLPVKGPVLEPVEHVLVGPHQPQFPGEPVVHGAHDP